MTQTTSVAATHPKFSSADKLCHLRSVVACDCCLRLRLIQYTWTLGAYPDSYLTYLRPRAVSHRTPLHPPQETSACRGNCGTWSRCSASLRSWISIRPSLFPSNFRNSSSIRRSSADDDPECGLLCGPLTPDEAWTLIAPARRVSAVH